MNNSAAIRIARVHSDGDMPRAYPYEYAAGFKANGLAVERLLPQLQQRLMLGLARVRVGTGAGTRAAIKLYFLTGHRYSGVFRARSQDASAKLFLSSLPKETTWTAPESF